MKDFIIRVFSVLVFIIGLMALMFEFMSIIAPEKSDSNQHYFLISTALVSFLIGYFLWKVASKKP